MWKTIVPLSKKDKHSSHLSHSIESFTARNVTEENNHLVSKGTVSILIRTHNSIIWLIKVHFLFFRKTTYSQSQYGLFIQMLLFFIKWLPTTDTKWVQYTTLKPIQEIKKKPEGNHLHIISLKTHNFHTNPTRSVCPLLIPIVWNFLES